MASSLYSQLPLNTSNSEIRTLTVHPSDTHEAPINCSLSVASLNDNCDFEALSYVWHEPSLADVAPVAILVNGYEFTPTPNLFSALQHLRLPQKARKLWVDAICIDQDNLDERSAQVPLMTRIYMSAQVVAVWLGPSNSDIDTYARLEPEMAAELRLAQDTFSARFESLSDSADPEIITEMEGVLKENIPKLLQLLPGHFLLTGNEYWSRMWTYQECCLPAVSRVFYCGYNLFTWEQVGSDVMLEHRRSWIDFVYQLGDQRRLSGGKRHTEEELGYIRSLNPVFDRANGVHGSPRQVGSSGVLKPRYHGPSVGLHENLEQTIFRKCMNPLDRFFALYGLVQDRFLPTVDYKKGVETVSAEVASYLVLSHLGARLFDHWDCRPQRASVALCKNVWPSWVPDFRTTTSSPSYIIHGFGVKPSPRNKVISIYPDFSTITIQGQSFGPARILARLDSNTIHNLELFARGLGQALSNLTTMTGLESSNKKITRLINVLLFPGRMDKISVPLVNALVEFLLDMHPERLNQLDTDKSFVKEGPPNLRLPYSSKMIETLWGWTTAGDQTESKIMFVTDNLHLGFSNAQMRDGDIVARLGDQRGSCVLRRCETESPGNPLEETVTMIGPSIVRYLPLIWNAETEDSDTWYEDMTVDETEPVVFTIR